MNSFVGALSCGQCTDLKRSSSTYRSVSRHSTPPGGYLQSRRKTLGKVRVRNGGPLASGEEEPGSHCRFWSESLNLHRACRCCLWNRAIKRAILSLTFDYQTDHCHLTFTRFKNIWAEG
ncbi:hypothetical protein OIU79_024945 [Salix purpurea]|uniref:Uncharacterized protein n=1 Tax=Salix purpurea TaxID=77065 RepID=A0A9Q0W3G0_SALPP|nr:hypothetical protein OIU79_024945 [Salix purpurea]